MSKTDGANLSAKADKKTPHRSPSRRWLITGIIVLLLGNALLWSLFGISRMYANKLLPGTSVNGLSLSGLTRPEAQAALVSHYTDILNRDVTLKANDAIKVTTLSQLGYTANIQGTLDTLYKTRIPLHLRIWQVINPQAKTTILPVIQLDQTAFDGVYPDIEKELTRESNNSALEMKNGQLVTAPPQTGIQLDKATVATTITTQGEGSPTIILPYTAIEPELASDAQVTAAKTKIAPLVAQPLVLTIDGTKAELTPEDIFSFIDFTIEDGNLTYTFNETKIKTKMTDVAKKTDVKAVTKTLLSTDNSVLSEGKDGKKLNVTTAASTIAKNLKAGTVTQVIALTSDVVARNTVIQTPEFQLGRYPGKYIEIDLSSQHLYIIDGQTLVEGFNASTGKWSTPTPVGEFTILNHISVAWSARYKLYMPYWMAIKPVNGAYDGYGIHGLPYWPNGAVEGVSHIGTPVSHGCIRLGPGAERFVYDWAPNGTPVVIHQ